MPGHFHFYAHLAEDKELVFDETESQHMFHVLRYAEGDIISATNGMGIIYEAIIKKAHKKQVVATIQASQEIPRIKNLHLAIGQLKNAERMEWLVEKCTELQVAGITFLNCQNSEKRKLNIDRLQKKALSALKQSHGAYLPYLSTDSFNNFINQKQAIYIAHCHPASNKISSALLPATCTVLIGPEGDFTAAEINTAINAGATPLNLGQSILRTETAVIATASVHYLL